MLKKRRLTKEDWYHFYPWPCANPGPWAGVWPEAAGRRTCFATDANANPGFFCLHLIDKGKVRLQTPKGIDRVLEPGDLFSIYKGMPYQFRALKPQKDEDIEMSWVRLQGPLTLDFMPLLGPTQNKPYARAQNPKKVRQLLDELIGLAKDFPANANQKALALLHQLADACAEMKTEIKEPDELAFKMRRIMRNEVGSGQNVEEFAKMFNISRSGMFLKFKEAFGQSPIEVLTEERIRHAKALLKETHLSIAEVALASGYSEPLYFSRQFKKETGQTPSGFRKA